MIEQEWLHSIPAFSCTLVPSAQRWTPTMQIWAKGLMPSNHHRVAFHNLRGNGRIERTWENDIEWYRYMIGAKSTTNWTKRAAVTPVFFPYSFVHNSNMSKLSTKCQIESGLLALSESDGNKAKPVIHNFLDTCHHLPLPTPSDRVKAPPPCHGPFAAVVAVILKALCWVRCCPLPAIAAIGAMWSNTLPLTLPRMAYTFHTLLNAFAESFSWIPILLILMNPYDTFMFHHYTIKWLV